MNQDPFLYDFGVLPETFDLQKPLSNITECLQGEELDCLLRISFGKQTESLSAYERFRLLARLMPELNLHPFKDWIAYLLKQVFSIEEPLTTDSCDWIWKESARILSEEHLDAASLLAKLTGENRIGLLCSCEDLKGFQSVPFSPVLNGNRLLLTSARTWNEWEREIVRTVSKFQSVGSHNIVFHLPLSYHFIRPDRYHTEEALTKKARNDEEKSILLSQCLRQLFLLCKESGLTLILHTEGEAEESLALLHFLEKSIGLPSLVLASAQSQALCDFARYTAEPHDAVLRCGVFLSDYPSEGELWEVLTRVSARYPFGYLQFMTAGDLRFSAVSRIRPKKTIHHQER